MLEPEMLPVFAGQATHCVPGVLYVLTGQFVHAVVLPAPYVPAGQVWHAVDTPSTKYCPAPQQTAVPVGVQCL